MGFHTFTSVHELNCQIDIFALELHPVVINANANFDAQLRLLKPNDFVCADAHGERRRHADVDDLHAVKPVNLFETILEGVEC
jgi:hypothetical protein